MPNSGQSSANNPQAPIPIPHSAFRIPLRLAVLISGGGRTLINLHDHITAGSLHAQIDVVVSSAKEAPGVLRAKERGLPVTVVDHQQTEQAFHHAVTEAVAGVDLVCMAGFLLLWRIPEQMYGRVINIHPALLPEFGGRGMYGLRVHEAVIAAGKTISGCTVHFCDNEYDHGPIILQQQVGVHPTDTPDQLAHRVFEQECIAYPQAVELFCQKRIRLIDRTVEIRPV